MFTFNRTGKLDFKCSKCGYEFSKQIAWLEANPEFVCERVGCDLLFKSEDFLRAFHEGEKETQKWIAEMKKKGFEIK